MTDFTILNTIPRDSNVRIYVNNKESYGIKTFFNILMDELICSEQYSKVEVISTNFFFIPFFILSDLRFKRYTINSLNFGLFNFINRKRSIYFLHGFPNLEDYGFFRFITLYFITKCSIYSSNLTFANSALTYSISKKIYNLNVSNCWKPSFQNFKEKVIIQKEKKKNIILVVGRIIKGKHIYEAIQAFCETKLDYTDWEFYIVGPIIDNRIENLINTDDRIKVKGVLIGEDLNQIYSQSKIFISLNPLEPLGLVYYEAMLYNLFIIAPILVGAFENPNNVYDKKILLSTINNHEILSALKTAIKYFDNYYDI
jgi:glycosyltransferase involved in cell wall biosynthesis